MEDALAGGWGEFGVAMAGAAAALAGLVMVVVSVNIREILALEGLSARAATAVGSLVFVVVAAGASLVPGQSLPVLGGEILAATVLAALLHIHSQRRNFTLTDRPLSERVSHLIAVPVQLAPLVVGAILLLTGDPGGLYWVAAGVVLTIIGSMVDAWVLMVEILR